jgi:chromosome segregation ATPase
MGKLTSPLVVVALALVAMGALVPAGGRAQPPAASHAGPRDAAADEVVLLRQAVERLAVVVVKSQVLAGRLAAQQQQVVREEDTIARAQDAIDAAGRRQELTRASLERVNTALANVVEEPRSELRRQFENLNGELANQDQEFNRLRTRLSNAEQILKHQQQSFAELDTALSSLIREVERPKP